MTALSTRLFAATAFGLAIVFGAALDAAGGAANRLAWVVGYAAIGSGCLAAPLVSWTNARRRASYRCASCRLWMA